MYFVFKNSKKTKYSFTTYEQARQYIRKQIRKHFKDWNIFGDSNPTSLTTYGYSIKLVK